MPIQYAAVFDENRVKIAEYPKDPKDAEAKLADNLVKIVASVDPKMARKRSIEDKDTKGQTYSVLSNGEGRIIACASIDTAARTNFAMLDAVEPLVRCPAEQLRNGKKLLQMKMDFYNNPANDKIASMTQELDGVIEVVSANVEAALKRGETLDVVTQKTVTLAEQARTFEQTSVAVKSDLFWRNLRLAVFVLIGAGAAALFIALVSCRPDFSACK